MCCDGVANFAPQAAGRQEFDEEITLEINLLGRQCVQRVKDKKASNCTQIVHKYVVVPGVCPDGVPSAVEDLVDLLEEGICVSRGRITIEVVEDAMSKATKKVGAQHTIHG